MTRPKSVWAVRHINALFGLGAAGGRPDGVLLETFATAHREAAEAAFGTLVERHGPMVLGVCRGVLGNGSPEVHDAFQATFLVLVRKSDSLWVRDSLGPWLHGVAFRVATKAKVAAARRCAHERRAAELAESAQWVEPSADDGCASALHEEIEKLPPKYRAPVVLCYLEGLTHDGAATTLGWPVGTVRGRLARARDLLRTRLARRGLVPSVGTLAAAFAAEGALASPPSLPEPMLHAVMILAAERPAGVASAAVAALAENGVRMSALTAPRGATLLVVLALVSLGTAGVVMTSGAGADRGPAAAAPPPAVQGGAGKDVPTTWPAGAEVKGRVLDHRGEAVAGAEVLLLGPGTITVFVRPGSQDGLVEYTLSTLQQPAPPPAVKTDGQGRFSLRRSKTATDRIAVVSKSMPLWEVFRKDVADPTDVVVRLPEPVALTLQADIPGKPATEEFLISGRLLNRVDRPSDSFLYRGLRVPNPGTRVVRSLPPAQYSVVRNNLTPLGNRSQMMTPCERRLVSIEPGKGAEVAFDRKTGRRVEGRVTGLEDVKLRYALMTISYLGPEEQMVRDGKPERTMTHFDVLAVGSDGRFTTPPLPPNRYEFRLAAMAAATPVLDNQSYDFDGEVTVDVPASGELPTVELVARRNPAVAADRDRTPDPAKRRLEVRVREDQVQPVQDFTVRLYGPPQESPEALGVDGMAVLSSDQLKNWNGGDLIVSAPGFASTVQGFGPVMQLQKLDLTLTRGKTVRLRVRDAAGRPIAPAHLRLPQVYLGKHRKDARLLFQINDLESRGREVEGMNFLNVRREADGDFAFQLAPALSEPLYFAFSDPEVLLYHEQGPVAASDLAGGVWDVVLPSPATLEVSLQATPREGEPSPFARGGYTLVARLAGETNGLAVLTAGALEGPEWSKSLGRLAPGSYSLFFQTTAAGPAARPGLEARAGEYRDRRDFDLKPGEQASIKFEPPAFNPDAWRGRLTANLIINPAGDRPVAGEEYQVSYVLANYGYLPVAQGKLSEGGRLRLENLAASGSSQLGGQYVVTVAGKPLGEFRLKDQPESQEFSFRTPFQSGDLAPDAEAQDLESGEPVRLADFRGRILLLEFWATWCGPCREPMQRLAALGRRRRDEWSRDVAVVAVSIDEDRNQLREYVRRNGLGVEGLRHLWSPRAEPPAASPPAAAVSAYSVSQVPTAYLIDRDGRILWQGHPGSVEVERKIEELLARASR